MKHWRWVFRWLGLLFVAAVGTIVLSPRFGFFVPHYSRITVHYRNGGTEDFTDAKYWEDFSGQDNFVSPHKRLRTKSSAVSKIDLIDGPGLNVIIHQ